MFGCCGCVNKKTAKEKLLEKIELTPDEILKQKQQELEKSTEDVKKNPQILVNDVDEKNTTKKIVNENETKKKDITIKENVVVADAAGVVCNDDGNDHIDDGLCKENNEKDKKDDGIVVVKENVLTRLKSDTSNITLEETIQLDQSHKNDNVNLTKRSESELLQNINNNNDNNIKLTNNSVSSTVTLINSNNSNNDDEKVKTSGQRESCLSRRNSSKSSMKKKVNYNDSTEIIPTTVSELTSINDDDEVFSDSIPSRLPRGDMCTPYPLKRGSMPGLVALPDWFNSEDREIGGILEPPATPVGRDELALKRHRFFSDLLTAAQAAAEHRVRFDPLGPIVAAAAGHHFDDDCDPNFRPSTSSDLEHLVNRLERIIDRLERTVSARELEFTNQLLNQTIINSNKDEIGLLTPQLPSPPSEIYQNLTEKLEERIIVLEKNFNHIEKLEAERQTCELIEEILDKKDQQEEVEEDFSVIPTVVTQLDYLNNTIILENMSVNGYQDITCGPLAEFLKLSKKIGGDVATQGEFVRKAFDAQLQYITLATQLAKPQDNKQAELLKPTSDQITAIQNFREKNRTSPFFNHLSAISESIPALGWVCVSPTPGPHVKEMNDAGQFYTNRVLKDWKEKDVTHVEWARSWVQTLNELQKFIKQYHTTGLVWSGKGQAPASCPPPPPPGMPPPPPIVAFDDLSLDGAQDRSALFDEINRGADITKNLKKVTSDMQTHKNAGLRTGPAPFVTPQPFKPVTAPKPGSIQTTEVKPPVFTRDGKKWLIEYQKSKRELKIDNAEMNNVVYMFKCQDSTLTVTGKINSIVIDSCKKCSVLFDSLVSSVEFVNCQSVQMQVLGKVPTISIDKTDGCQMYLSDKSLEVEIISSKSSEMNVMMPLGDGDFSELPIPEQFKTTIKGKSLNTTFVESLG